MINFYIYIIQQICLKRKNPSGFSALVLPVSFANARDKYADA